jgi:hypothetical protein
VMSLVMESFSHGPAARQTREGRVIGDGWPVTGEEEDRPLALIKLHGDSKMCGMDEQKRLPMRTVPITVYKEEPTTEGPSEWHEIWIAERPETSEWILCQRHGIWNEAEKKAYFDVPVLSAPFETEEQVQAELDEQIKFLDGIGFTHKYTLVWDPEIMGMRGEKL